MIGPRGVIDVVSMTGKLVNRFAGFTSVGETLYLQLVIYFPWAPAEGKFKGELSTPSARCKPRAGTGGFAAAFGHCRDPRGETKCLT